MGEGRGALKEKEESTDWEVRGQRYLGGTAVTANQTSIANNINTHNLALKHNLLNR